MNNIESQENFCNQSSDVDDNFNHTFSAHSVKKQPFSSMQNINSSGKPHPNKQQSGVINRRSQTQLCEPTSKFVVQLISKEIENIQKQNQNDESLLDQTSYFTNDVQQYKQQEQEGGKSLENATNQLKNQQQLMESIQKRFQQVRFDHNNFLVANRNSTQKNNMNQQQQMQQRQSNIHHSQIQDINPLNNNNQINNNAFNQNVGVSCSYQCSKIEKLYNEQQMMLQKYGGQNEMLKRENEKLRNEILQLKNNMIKKYEDIRNNNNVMFSDFEQKNAQIIKQQKEKYEQKLKEARNQLIELQRQQNSNKNYYRERNQRLYTMVLKLEAEKQELLDKNIQLIQQRLAKQTSSSLQPYQHKEIRHTKTNSGIQLNYHQSHKNELKKYNSGNKFAKNTCSSPSSSCSFQSSPRNLNKKLQKNRTNESDSNYCYKTTSMDTEHCTINENKQSKLQFQPKMTEKKGKGNTNENKKQDSQRIYDDLFQKFKLLKQQNEAMDIKQNIERHFSENQYDYKSEQESEEVDASYQNQKQHLRLDNGNNNFSQEQSITLNDIDQQFLSNEISNFSNQLGMLDTEVGITQMGSKVISQKKLYEQNVSDISSDLIMNTQEKNQLLNYPTSSANFQKSTDTTFMTNTDDSSYIQKLSKKKKQRRKNHSAVITSQGNFTSASITDNNANNLNIIDNNGFLSTEEHQISQNQHNYRNSIQDHNNISNNKQYESAKNYQQMQQELQRMQFPNAKQQDNSHQQKYNSVQLPPKSQFESGAGENLRIFQNELLQKNQCNFNENRSSSQASRPSSQQNQYYYKQQNEQINYNSNNYASNLNTISSQNNKNQNSSNNNNNNSFDLCDGYKPYIGSIYNKSMNKANKQNVRSSSIGKKVRSVTNYSFCQSNQKNTEKKKKIVNNESNKENKNYNNIILNSVKQQSTQGQQSKQASNNSSFIIAKNSTNSKTKSHSVGPQQKEMILTNTKQSKIKRKGNASSINGKIISEAKKKIPVFSMIKQF